MKRNRFKIFIVTSYILFFSNPSYAKAISDQIIQENINNLIFLIILLVFILWLIFLFIMYAQVKANAQNNKALSLTMQKIVDFLSRENGMKL